MPEKNNKRLEYNQGEKSINVPFIIYAILKSLLEKMNTRQSKRKLQKKIRMTMIRLQKYHTK